MNNKFVTFIMPAYNAAATIDETIRSLKEQDLDNWYLIVVDDGSSDNTKDIIEDIAKRDTRIKLITQTNQGPAVARANAIAIAETEYIAILDADDLLSKNYVRLLVDRAKDTKADIIMPNVKCIDKEGVIEENSHFGRQKLTAKMIINNSLEAFDMSVSWKLHGWMIIKTNLAKTYYTFDNVCYSKFNSDEYISRYLYLKSKTVALTTAIYFYRYVATSITHHFSVRHFDRILTLNHLANLCIDEDVPIETTHKVYSMYRSCIIQSFLLYELHSNEIDDGGKTFSMIMDTYKAYKKNFPSKLFQYVGLKEKIKYTISLSGENVIKLIVYMKSLLSTKKRTVKN